MPSPFSQISDVLKSAVEHVNDQPDVPAWPDTIDSGDIVEGADATIVDGAPAGSWAGQIAEHAAELASKYEAERESVGEDAGQAASALTGNGVLGAGNQIFSTIKDVGGKLVDAIEARVEQHDEVVEDAIEDDVYDAAPELAEPAEADDDPYDNDN